MIVFQMVFTVDFIYDHEDFLDERRFLEISRYWKTFRKNAQFLKNCQGFLQLLQRIIMEVKQDQQHDPRAASGPPSMDPDNLW